jgi:hypothetical protein
MSDGVASHVAFVRAEPVTGRQPSLPIELRGPGLGARHALEQKVVFIEDLDAKPGQLHA